jgi:hypothetical protein
MAQAAIIALVVLALLFAGPNFRSLVPLPRPLDADGVAAPVARPPPPPSPRRQVGTWIGNTWIPPPGWRIFSVEELQDIYKNKSILWIGDSTARRASLTLYAVLNHTLPAAAAAAVAKANRSHNGDEGEADNNDGSSSDRDPARHVSVPALDDGSVIDLNKRRQTEPCLRWPASLTREVAVPARDADSSSGSSSSGSSSSSSSSSSGSSSSGNGTRREIEPQPINASSSAPPPLLVRNETLPGPQYCRAMPRDPSRSYLLVGAACVEGVARVAEWERRGWSDYSAGTDLWVMALGVWHADRPWDCDRTRPLAEQVDVALRALDLVLARRPELTVVWRTSGYSGKAGSRSDAAREFSRHLMDRLDERAAAAAGDGGVYRMTYVDWGSAVEPRSFGADRIAGDIHAHYGLEPRLVLVQMIANRLRDLERQQREEPVRDGAAREGGDAGKA